MAGYDPAIFGALPGTTVNADPSSTANIAGSAGLALGTGTGSHGVIPIASNLGGGMGAAISEFKDWLDTPFKTPLSPWGVTILVGTVLVAILAWNFIIYHVRVAAETL